MKMPICANKIIVTLEPFVLPVLVGVVCILASAALLLTGVRQIKKQIKLYNSITLVELKHFKLHYYGFGFVVAFLIFYTVTQMADVRSPEFVLLQEAFAMKRWQCNTTLSFVLLLLSSLEFVLVVLARSRSAVVDKGVYCGLKYLDWYYVHDYIIDEARGIVVLSSDPYTFFTLSGTTPPLHVAKNDIPKLKFILNKNKNKFSGFVAHDGETGAEPTTEAAEEENHA